MMPGETKPGQSFHRSPPHESPFGDLSWQYDEPPTDLDRAVLKLREVHETWREKYPDRMFPSRISVSIPAFGPNPLHGTSQSVGWSSHAGFVFSDGTNASWKQVHGSVSQPPTKPIAEVIRNLDQIEKAVKARYDELFEKHGKDLKTIQEFVNG